MQRFLNGLQRRLKRMRRRKAVGRAYDMALEIARTIPRGVKVLDVGCGNGFIAHHLAGLLQSNVVGLDVAKSPDTPVRYLRYDGRHFPVKDKSFDGVLLCYVLHHAQNFKLVMNEVRRVLKDDGLLIVYEDIPALGIDRLVCWLHNRKWRHRTGACTFQLEHEWRELFSLSGFTVINERPLSRWRNVFHPVSRRLFVLKANGSDMKALDLKTKPVTQSYVRIGIRV